MLSRTISGAEEKAECVEVPAVAAPLIHINSRIQELATDLYERKFRNGFIDREEVVHAAVVKELESYANLFGIAVKKKEIDKTVTDIVQVIMQKETQELRGLEAIANQAECATLAKDILMLVNGRSVTKKDIEEKIKSAYAEIYLNQDAKPYIESLRIGIYNEIIKSATASKIIFPQEVIISKAQEVLVDIDLKGSIGNTDSAVRNAGVGMLFTALSGTNWMSTLVSDKALLGLAAIYLVRMLYKVYLSVVQQTIAKKSVATLSKEMTRIENFSVLLEYMEKNISGRYRFLIKKYMKISLQNSLQKYTRREKQLRNIFSLLSKAKRKKWAADQLYAHLSQRYDYIFNRLNLDRYSPVPVEELEAQVKNKLPELRGEVLLDRTHVEELLQRLMPTYNADFIKYNIVESLVQSLTLQLEPLFIEAKQK